MSDTNPWCPWLDRGWQDGDRPMPEWVPEHRTISSDLWVALRAPSGGGWMIDGEVPWPGRTGRDLTPLKPFERPKGPAMPVAPMSEAALRAAGLWPAPGDAERALAELDLRRRSRQPPLIRSSGAIEQHTAVSQYVEPVTARPPSFQD
jgi:hypothetical protein